MAKAQFHTNQKVWVESVGAWAVVQKLVPIWAKGFDEPVRITYDVGLGREFQAKELRAEEQADDPSADDGGVWRLMRAKNKWQEPHDCAHHPYPGTYPVVVTDRQDWGGWRTPGAEYDRDPEKIETQARMIVSAPRLLRLVRELEAFVAEAEADAPAELQEMARRGAQIMRFILDKPAPAAEAAPPRVPAADAA